MTKRVGRAIRDQLILQNVNIDESPPVDWDAVAAGTIFAQREPTEAMLKAIDCAGEKRGWLSGQMHIASWKAMIDEALK